MSKVRTLAPRSKPASSLETPTDLSAEGVASISATLNALLADAFALYLKTKNFHWHVSGPHFRDYHLLLDEQAEEILGTTDELAERVRRIGGTTLRSSDIWPACSGSRTTTPNSFRRWICCAS
jgi:starvation-inducible DNA-binding protein